MKLVILDRDGTINHDSDDYIKSPDEWVPLPGALEAVARLSRAGWTVVVATNQSGLARGLFTRETLEAMHDKMRGAVAALGGRIDAIYLCPHAPGEGCDCRKPLPGLFRRIAADLGVSLQGVPVVGDSLRDLQAGAAVGCEPHLVRTGKAAHLDASGLAAVVQQVPGTRMHRDLAACVDELLRSDASAAP